MFFKIILLFLASAVAVSSACNIMGVAKCNNYDLVEKLKFHAFVPRDEFDETCSNMRIVLACVFDDDYMDGCTSGETFFYDMQRDVSNAVCNDGRYMNHVNCLGNAEMENEVSKKCIDVLSDVEPTCEILKSTRACVSSLIMTKCGEDDSKYMDTLTYAFLKPYGEHISCKLEEPELSKITTATTTDAMSTQSSKMMTTTTSSDTTTQSPSTGSILVVPSLLIGVIVVSINRIPFLY